MSSATLSPSGTEGDNWRDCLISGSDAGASARPPPRDSSLGFHPHDRARRGIPITHLVKQIGGACATLWKEPALFYEQPLRPREPHVLPDAQAERRSLIATEEELDRRHPNRSEVHHEHACPKDQSDADHQDRHGRRVCLNQLLWMNDTSVSAERLLPRSRCPPTTS